MPDNLHLPALHLPHAKRIAIVGGGPAGLTLARLLQMGGITVTVYERDTSADTRGQGGSLDLHEDSGQMALIAAGLGERFRGMSRPDGQHSRVFDKHGKVHAELRAEDEVGTRPEIDRGALRDLLLRSLADGTVVWGRLLRRIARGAERRLRLDFDAETVAADLVLGCDGG